VDKNGAVYFRPIILSFEFNLIFVLSSQTEVGSAGEQPIRDKLDG